MYDYFYFRKSFFISENLFSFPKIYSKSFSEIKKDFRKLKKIFGNKKSFSEMKKDFRKTKKIFGNKNSFSEISFSEFGIKV